MARLNKDIGKTLKDIRVKLGMPLDVVIENLKDENIKYYKVNLSRIERQETNCSALILGALCKIYEIDPKEVLYY